MKIQRFFFTTTNLALIFIISSCSRMKVRDVTIKIKPYSEGDRGKFWEICIDRSSVGFMEKPFAFFEIHSKDGQKKEYEIDFIHLEDKCNIKNVYVSFLHRHSSMEEREWIGSLNSEDVDFIVVRIKSHWENDSFIFEKKIELKRLD